MIKPPLDHLHLRKAAQFVQQGRSLVHAPFQTALPACRGELRRREAAPRFTERPFDRFRRQAHFERGQ
jgi:hypothetical protein